LALSLIVSEIRLLIT